MAVNLCQFEGYSCFGCCGEEFGSCEEVEEAIGLNTREFLEFKDKQKFAERCFDLRACGVCMHLVFEDNKVLCPLHPGLNNGEDFRDPECERDYLCKTFQWFLDLDEKTKEDFIEFIKNKNPDWYEYSTNMDNGNFMNEFLEWKQVRKGVNFIGVGCGALIVNEKNQVLLMLRKGNLSGGASGMWSQPGGTVEFCEKIEDAIKRELKEELDIGIAFLGPIMFDNDIREENGKRMHWVVGHGPAKISSGEPKIMEPDKTQEIKWFDLNEIPENTIGYTKAIIERFKEFLKGI